MKKLFHQKTGRLQAMPKRKGYEVDIRIIKKSIRNDKYLGKQKRSFFPS